MVVLSDIVWKNEAGQIHRKDGPAIIQEDGLLHWFINGFRHRDDGPAVENINGGRFWYWRGQNLTFEKWCEMTDKTIEERAFLKLKYL